MKRTPNRATNRKATRDGHAATAPTRPNLLTGEDLPPAPRQRRSLENRERLKAAALRLFGRQGYAGTSIEEIAGHADLAVGGFYLHFRTKRQLLVALMDDLLQALSEVDLQMDSSTEPRKALRALLSRAFSTDLQFLGAYRAWQEVILTDAELAGKHKDIHAWTTWRVLRTFQFLQTLPRARPGVDVEGLACVIDTFFWALLAEALRLPRIELDHWLDSATDLIFHALFVDHQKVVNT